MKIPFLPLYLETDKTRGRRHAEAQAAIEQAKREVRQLTNGIILGLLRRNADLEIRFRNPQKRN